MSGAPAIELRELSGRILTPASRAEPAALVVDRLVLRLHQFAVDLAARRAGIAARIEPDAVVLQVEAMGIPVEVQITARATTDGLLHLEVAGLRALSFLPLPGGLAAGVLREKVEGKPGVVAVSGSRFDFDLGAVLRHFHIPVQQLPPLRRVSQGTGWAELEYAGEPEEAV